MSEVIKLTTDGAAVNIHIKTSMLGIDEALAALPKLSTLRYSLGQLSIVQRRYKLNSPRWNELENSIQEITAEAEEMADIIRCTLWILKEHGTLNGK